MRPNKSRRSIILIEPYRQLRFGLMFIALNLLFSLCFLGIFGYFLMDIYDAVVVYFSLDPQQAMVAKEKFAGPALIAALFFVVFIGATLLLSARYTHQFYGPMVSIRRFLDDLLGDRNPTPLNLRSTDQLADLAERLNRVSSQLVMTGPSRKALDSYLDALLRGEKVAAPRLPPTDPLWSLAQKVAQLAEKT